MRMTAVVTVRDPFGDNACHHVTAVVVRASSFLV